MIVIDYLHAVRTAPHQSYQNWVERIMSILNLTLKTVAICILNKKERYIKFSLKLRIFRSSIVKEYIDIYNHQCFKVYMTYRGAR